MGNGPLASCSALHIGTWLHLRECASKALSVNKKLEEINGGVEMGPRFYAIRS